jgi:hypothetical protein
LNSSGINTKLDLIFSRDMKFAAYANLLSSDSMNYLTSFNWQPRAT